MALRADAGRPFSPPPPLAPASPHSASRLPAALSIVVVCRIARPAHPTPIPRSPLSVLNVPLEACASDDPFSHLVGFRTLRFVRPVS